MTSERTSDAGFSLVELLVAMIVLSIGVIAVLGVLRVGIDSGRVQREISTAELALRSYAEHIRAEPYVACAGIGTYGAGFSGTDLFGGRRLPANRSLRPGDPSSPEVRFIATVEEVFYLREGALDDGRLTFTVDDEDGGIDFAGVCADPDQGLQLIRIQVRVDSSASGEAIEGALETSIVKRGG